MRLLNIVTYRLSRMCQPTSDASGKPPDGTPPTSALPLPESLPKLTEAPTAKHSELLYRQIQLGIGLECTQALNQAANKALSEHPQTATGIEDGSLCLPLGSFDDFGSF